MSFSGFTIRGRRKGSRVSSEFAGHLFRSERFRSYLDVAGGGTNINNLSQRILENFPLTFPKDREQDKISSYLETVETKIEQLTRKKALLEDYKKGCMQQLFTQKLRFKDGQGNDFPDWAETTVGETFDWVRTNSLSRDKLNYGANGEVQNIHYGDIHSKFHANFRQGLEKVPYISGSLRADFAEEDFCKPGDVVIADASEDYTDIGKAIEIVELSDPPLVAGLHTYIARPKGWKLVLGFAGYLLRSATMRRQTMRIAQGISVLGVSKGNLATLTLELPHPDEQRKIANFLSAIDTKISLVEDELFAAQDFKKGLLQQMFV
nr:restriction endonuclease subunit S [Aliiroseovarius sp. F47248L]